MRQRPRLGNISGEAMRVLTLIVAGQKALSRQWAMGSTVIPSA
jgi:hypothetical protein